MNLSLSHSAVKRRALGISYFTLWGPPFPSPQNYLLNFYTDSAIFRAASGVSINIDHNKNYEISTKQHYIEYRPQKFIKSAYLQHLATTVRVLIMAGLFNIIHISPWSGMLNKMLVDIFTFLHLMAE